MFLKLFFITLFGVCCANRGQTAKGSYCIIKLRPCVCSVKFEVLVVVIVRMENNGDKILDSELRKRRRME